MITIDNKPHKRTEHFKGTITLPLSDEAKPNYDFELLKITNGSVTYDVKIDPSYQLSAEHFNILRRTILYNVGKEQVNWRAQEKEGKP